MVFSDPARRVLALPEGHEVRNWACDGSGHCLSVSFFLGGRPSGTQRLCAQKSLLAVLLGSYGIPGIERGLAACKANARLAVLLLRPHCPFLGACLDLLLLSLPRMLGPIGGWTGQQLSSLCSGVQGVEVEEPILAWTSLSPTYIGHRAVGVC